MKIAVDATPWFNERGYGRFTRELLGAAVRRAEGHRFVWFVDARDVGRLQAPARNVEVRGVRLGARPTDAASADGSRSPFDLLRLTRAVGREPGVDVLFYPTVYTYFPVPRGVRALVTIHDAIVERDPRSCLPTWRARLFWRLKVAAAIRGASALLTVSDFARDDLRRHLDTRGKPLHVTGEAPSAAFRPDADPAEIAAVLRRLDVPTGAAYFTYVGGFNPHKNLDLLVRVHARVARAASEPVYLVLVGTLTRDVFHSGLEALRDTIRASGTEGLVRWADFTPDEELRALHCGARALLLPSRAEGFGLPAVEAAACGTPVLATTQSPLPQLLEGGGVFVDPDDEEGWVRAWTHLLENPGQRETLGRGALEAARALTWERAADRLLAALEEAAS